MLSAVMRAEPVKEKVRVSIKGHKYKVIWFLELGQETDVFLHVIADE